MNNSAETQSDPNKEMSFAEAIRLERILGGEEPVEPKDVLEEVPGSLSPEGAGE